MYIIQQDNEAKYKRYKYKLSQKAWSTQSKTIKKKRTSHFLTKEQCKFDRQTDRQVDRQVDIDYVARDHISQNVGKTLEP